jgi:hypothetical protein
MSLSYGVSKRHKPWYAKILDKIDFNGLLGASWVALAAHTFQSLTIKGSFNRLGLLAFSILAITTLAAFYLWESPHSRLLYLQRWVQKVGLLPFIWFVSLLVFFLDSSSLPVLATTGGTGAAPGFFFANIQTKINTILATNPNSATVIPILTFGFGILQILMIAYIAFSVAKVVDAAREDEDWKQAAKIPLIVVMAVVAGDFAVGLV